MYEIEFIRVFAAFIMLIAASYCDLKSREVNDMLWLVFGVFGVILYAFDAPNFSINAVATGLGFCVALLCWKLRLFGGADVLALVTLSIVLPTYYRVPATAAVLIIGLVAASLYAVINNIYRNLMSLMVRRKLFTEIDDSIYKKLVAFFVIHERHESEKYGFTAEAIIDGKHRFVFRHKPDSEAFWNGSYVTTTLPTMLFLLVGLGFFITTLVII